MGWSEILQAGYIIIPPSFYGAAAPVMQFTEWRGFNLADYIAWFKDPNTQNPSGGALKINDKEWFIKDPEDNLDIDVDIKSVEGKSSVKIIMMQLLIIGKSQGIYKIKKSIKITKDES